MINPNKIEEMARTIQAALPPGLKSVGEEVDKKSQTGDSGTVNETGSGEPRRV